MPVFIDKHLSDNWKDARQIYDTARELKIPLMAGSSVPGTWRHPAADVERGARLTEIVGITYGSTDAYGFHGLEAVQSLAEQRRGGETGVRAVQCLSASGLAGPRRADHRPGTVPGRAGACPAVSRRASPRSEGGAPAQAAHRPSQRWPAGQPLRAEPRGGCLDGGVARRRGRSIVSTEFWTQEGRPAAHFSLLLEGIQRMFFTEPRAGPWNARS